jgi:hypothetical protein
MEPITAVAILGGLKIAGTGVSALGFIFGVFKVINWVKNKFTSIDANVVELKNSMDTNFNGLREDIKHQTTTLASALSEQRQDFRTFYAPTLLMMQQFQQPAPVRAKPSKRVKK